MLNRYLLIPTLLMVFFVGYAQSEERSGVSEKEIDLINIFFMKYKSAIEKRSLLEFKNLHTDQYFEHATDGRKITIDEGLRAFNSLFRAASVLKASVEVSNVRREKKELISDFKVVFDFTVNGKVQSMGSLNKGRFIISNNKVNLAESWVISLL